MRSIIIQLSAAALLLGFAGTASALTSLHLAQNSSPISGVTMVAKEKGFFENNGLDVRVSAFTTGRQALEAVLGGGADVATTAEAPTTAAAMAGQPIAFLARTQYSDLKTLARKDSGIASVADLKGKRIGYTAGTGGEVYTMRLLEIAGLTPRDVSLANLRPQDMAPALAAGSIDAFNTWEPHVANARRVLGDAAVLIDTRGVYAETFNIVTTRSFLEANMDAMESFMKALVEAVEFIAQNPEESIEIIARVAGMPEADLRETWDDYVYDVMIDSRTMDVLHAHAAWRLDSGNHPRGATMPDFTQVIDARPLRAAAPERVQVEGLN